MVRLTWSSTASTSPSIEAQPMPSAATLEFLFGAWQETIKKADFIAALDVVTAQALTSLIMARTAPHMPKRRRTAA